MSFASLNFSIRKSVLIIYLIDILFAISSIVYAIGDNDLVIIVIYVILFILVIILIWKTDIISEKKINKKNLFHKNK